MNKVILLSALLACAGPALHAQTKSYSDDASSRRSRMPSNTCPKVYFAVSTGINNPTGLLGLGFDIAVAPQVSVGGGFGLLSTWGPKVAVESRYYFDECHRGWAVGGGLTSSSGFRAFSIQLETMQYGSNTPVLLDLHRKTNVFVSGYRFFTLGRSSRFHLQLGYSKGLAPARYTEKSGLTLTGTSDAVVRGISPGGVVLGLGFSFGIGQ